MLQSDYFPPQHRGQMENGHFVTSSDQMEKLKDWKKNKKPNFLAQKNSQIHKCVYYTFEDEHFPHTMMVVTGDFPRDANHLHIQGKKLSETLCFVGNFLNHR